MGHNVYLLPNERKQPGRRAAPPANLDVGQRRQPIWTSGSAASQSPAAQIVRLKLVYYRPPDLLGVSLAARRVQPSYHHPVPAV